jgi:hypothetical protein
LNYISVFSHDAGTDSYFVIKIYLINFILHLQILTIKKLINFMANDNILPNSNTTITIRHTIMNYKI